MNRVPGNFYISSMDFLDVAMTMELDGFHIDNSFIINHLSFGHKANFKSIKESFPGTDV